LKIKALPRGPLRQQGEQGGRFVGVTLQTKQAAPIYKSKKKVIIELH